MRKFEPQTDIIHFIYFAVHIPVPVSIAFAILQYEPFR